MTFNIFTDAIKDVIGNNPVVDQFDTFYPASFFRSYSDEVISGSIIQIKKTNKEIQITIPDRPRGRVYNKYTSEEQDSAITTEGSSEVSYNPDLSTRLIPRWESVSYSSYRFQTLTDFSERIYDSCIPNFQQILDGENASTFINYDRNWLSPEGNYLSQSTGFIFMNSDRDDQFTLNEWSYAFPFEEKYDTSKRYAILDSKLGIVSTKKVTSTGSYHFDITEIDQNQIMPPNLIPIASYNFLSETHISNSIQPMLSDYGNSRLGFNPVSGVFHKYGHGYIVPVDIRLDTYVTHSYPEFPSLTPPSPERLTGSLTQNHLLDFVYGFGDNKGAQYKYFTAGTGTHIFTDKFTGSIEPVTSLGTTYNNDFLKITWSDQTTELRVSGADTWTVHAKTHLLPIYDYAGIVGIKGTGYQSISGTTNFDVGIYNPFWLPNGETFGTHAIVSDNPYDGNMSGSTVFSGSVCAFDITSSYPWSFNYYRAVSGRYDDTLSIYFAGTPDYISHEYSANGLEQIQLIENLTGTSTSQTNATNAFAIMQKYDSLVDGININRLIDDTVPGQNKRPFSAGAYRIVFAFKPSTKVYTLVSKASIDRIQIRQFTNSDIQPVNDGGVIGANNYPSFRQITIDDRVNQLKGGAIYTAEVENSRQNYNCLAMSVSPIIRGWKYGLYSGRPSYSKFIFSRNHFGHVRDMFEQRLYTKNIFVKSEGESAFQIGTNNTINRSAFVQEKNSVTINDSPVFVKFGQLIYTKNEKGIGKVEFSQLSPTSTSSSNFSPEATSSIPYID